MVNNFFLHDLGLREGRTSPYQNKGGRVPPVSPGSYAPGQRWITGQCGGCVPAPLREGKIEISTRAFGFA